MNRFDENEVRVMGRSAAGVKGMDLDGSIVVGADVVNEEDLILIVTESGYGKISPISEYRLTHRGSKGVKAYNVTDKNGLMTDLEKVNDIENYDLMLITNSGVVMKMPLSQVSILKRATQGLRLINLKDDQIVSSVAVVEKEEESSNDDVNSESIDTDTEVSDVVEQTSEEETE